MSEVFFTWNVHYECNYKCTYCHAPKPEDFPSKRIAAEKWIQIWKDVYEKYGEADIIASGGEPFAYPGFMEVLKEITKWHIVEVCTNLFWDVDEFINEVGPERVRVGTSFHPEFSDIDEFMEKIIKIKDAGFETFVNFVPWPPMLDKMKSIKNRVEGAGLRFMLQPFIGNYEGRQYPEGYTEDEMRYFDEEILDSEMNRSIMSFKLNKPDESKESEEKLDDSESADLEKSDDNTRKPIGKLCNMGHKYGYILPDGNVKRCCSDESGMLGDMIEGTFKMHDSVQECPSTYCHCERRMVAGEEDNWRDKWGRNQE